MGWGRPAGFSGCRSALVFVIGIAFPPCHNEILCFMESAEPSFESLDVVLAYKAKGRRFFIRCKQFFLDLMKLIIFYPITETYNSV